MWDHGPGLRTGYSPQEDRCVNGDEKILSVGVNLRWGVRNERMPVGSAM